jgi:hypothetical protein
MLWQFWVPRAEHLELQEAVERLVAVVHLELQGLLVHPEELWNSEEFPRIL